jgi:hypothetical protein
MENENVDFSDMIRSFVNNDFELYIKVLRATSPLLNIAEITRVFNLNLIEPGFKNKETLFRIDQLKKVFNETRVEYLNEMYKILTKKGR